MKFAKEPTAATEMSPEKEKEERSGLDRYTLRVRGGDPNAEESHKRPTDPVGLSRSILHVLHENPEGFCRVLSVGPVALNIVMEAFRRASEVADTKAHGQVLVMRQTEDTVPIGDNPRARRTVTRIFSIDIKHAR